MRKLTILFFTLLSFSLCAKPAIDPASVAILYNSNLPESKQLAEYYAQQRKIPRQNLVGLNLSNQGHISRTLYQSAVLEPLRRHFTKQAWWKLNKTSDGYTIPSQNKIRLLVCMYGVPYGIKRDKKLTKEAGSNRLAQSNEASVDSELAAFGIHGLPIAGPISNKYFKANESFANRGDMSPFFMVGRIDAADYSTSKRLIDDAIATEKQGLWGMCYLDLALKGGSYKIGDDWINRIDTRNWSLGIPTVIDKTKQTYLSNYPMRDASLYYGWYTRNRNGPFLNPEFRFKRGAVAVHLHSFSASDLRNPKTNWVGPLIDKGAAATVGNVYEPYLTMTHHFDILHDRLLAGYSLIEAASMAMPVLSWQGVVIGDPLYRPFLHLDCTGQTTKDDTLYRMVRLAFLEWANDPAKLTTKLRAAGAKKSEGRFYEIIGLWSLHKFDNNTAAAFFNSAAKNYFTPHDHIRIAHHLAQLNRACGHPELATQVLRDALAGNEDEPEAKSLKALLNILNPPPPAAAKPRKK